MNGYKPMVTQKILVKVCGSQEKPKIRQTIKQINNNNGKNVMHAESGHVEKWRIIGQEGYGEVIITRIHVI